MDENTPKTLKKYTVTTEEESIDRFKLLKEQSGIATDGQFFTALIDRYEQPQRVNDRTRELSEKADNLQHLLTEAEGVKSTQQQRISELERQLAEAEGRANQNAEATNRMQLEMDEKVANLTPKENQAVVTFTPDNMKVLEYVAARESKRRGQPWSISHVINFFIYARFIKGMLNGDLGSVGDAELRKMGINLKTKAKQAVEI